MVDAVKVRRDQHRLEVPLQLRRRTLPCWTAAVMKTARPWLSAAKAGISSTTRRANRWPRRRGSRSGDAEPPCRGHVDVGIRVMRRVNAPEERHRVFQAVDEIM